MAFDRDTALKKTADGTYTAIVSDAWNVNVGPNGGYIAAIILNGMKQELGSIAHTRSVTYHFLSASVPGPAELHVQPEKRGRTLSTATAKLIQGDRTVAMAIATFADSREFHAFNDVEPPVVPGPEAIERSGRMRPGMTGHVPFRDQYDQRIAIGPIPPNTAEAGHVGGWTRFTKPRPFDDLAMVAISDSWYPSLMARQLPVRMHAPTVDHSVHFLTSLPYAGLTEEDFLLVEFKTETANDGYLIEDGLMWAPDGTLIARSRQLAIMMSFDSD